MNINVDGWSKSEHIVVAVSTGIDSMSLLHILLNDYQDTYSKLTCVHVNHGLRNQSEEEERFLQEYCEQNHIELYVKHLDLTHLVQKGNSIQHEARQRRYDWFETIIKDINADVLLTAHHLDDQLETIFYRLFTGRSTRNSLGISSVTYYDNYRICRPLLNVMKSDIITYQKVNRVPYYEDLSNHDTKYVRNDIRHRLLPAIDKNPNLNTHQLLKFKEWHDRELQSLNHQAQDFIIQFVSESEKQRKYTFSRDTFNALDTNVKMIVMDRLFNKLDHQLSIPQTSYKEWFEQIQSNKSQFNLDLTDKWIIQIAYDTLIITVKSEVDKNKIYNMHIERPGNYLFNGYKIHVSQNLPFTTYPLKVRVRQTGDVFKLNGQEGHKKVSRLFIDNKIVADEREHIPLIINNSNEIIAIGCLYVQENFKDLIMISNNGDE